jgi:hypothetical protein
LKRARHAAEARKKKEEERQRQQVHHAQDYIQHRFITDCMPRMLSVTN